jgi:lipopolysaccharide/colanic/teichoic acid biosynthesis glycosyltransferase
MRALVYQSKPGITGIGSIVFRDEEELISKATMPPHEFYEKVIAPYKGALELWYNRKKSFGVDLKIIFLTAWVILFPKSTLMYKIFPDLPERSV